MTDIDTAKIRARWCDSTSYTSRDIDALCDALDAARAERDFHAQACCHCALPEYRAWIARAEAAEAELAVVKDFKEYMLAHDPGPFVTELEERVEAAEARIDAALDDLNREDINQTGRIRNARRALLDTAAIRGSVSGRCDAVAENLVDVCDALDAARTERDGSKIREQMRLADWREQRDRAEAAEVRIAAALALYADRRIQGDDLVLAMARALTEAPNV